MSQWDTYKTTNAAYFPKAPSSTLNSQVPTWVLVNSPGNPWDDFISAMTGGWVDNVSANNKNLLNANIVNSASIGIGTFSPSDQLHVYGTGSQEAVRVENTASGGVALLRLKTDNHEWQFAAGGSTSGFNYAYIYDNTLSQFRLKIYPGGTVGFGSTIPQHTSDLDAENSGLVKGDLWYDSAGGAHLKL